ncbi:hypothetical protein HK102_003726 [Quaeritorhiza haematococci]|nr:hypothetical protein HK102_003726 [Quaeritorhiza haematococci]
MSTPDYDALLSQKYATLAVNLPPVSCTIWSLVQEDIDSADGGNCGYTSAADLLAFLSEFFSGSILSSVERHLVCLEDAGLHLSGTKSTIAHQLLDDAMQAPSQYGLGHVAHSDVVGRRGRAVGTGQRPASRRGKRGGRQPRWAAPGRSFRDARRTQFATTKLTGARTHDPFAVDGTVFLSIDPFTRRTEFAKTNPFYVANTLSQAFEYPFQVHPAMKAEDTVGVFAFRVETRILHGETAFMENGQEDKFNILWFEAADDDWANFCQANLSGSARRHEYDIVIGPACCADKDVVPLARNGQLCIQIAFCTERSWRWLESKVEVVFLERSRGPAADPYYST